MDYPLAEQVEIILLFGELGRQFQGVSEEYARRFPGVRHPSDRQIRRIVNRFVETGQVQHRPRAGRPRVQTNAEIEQRLQVLIGEQPNISTRSAGEILNISHSSVWNMLHRLKFHPYRIHVHQLLHGDDFARRTEFCNWLDAHIDDDEEFVAIILWSDEATFHHDAVVNVHNAHYWAQENPHWLRVTNEQVQWSTNVWCGLLGNRVVGPFFLPPRLTGNSYLQFLRQDLETELQNLPAVDVNAIWFQQDGAGPHFYTPVLNYLDEKYPNRWIGRGGPVPWPARSPDLTPLDFFLWGTIKERVYITAPLNVEDLQQRIKDACVAISAETLSNVRKCVRQRIRDCIAAEGRNFEHFD